MLNEIFGYHSGYGNADLFSFFVPAQAGTLSNQVAGFPPARERLINQRLLR